MGQEQPHKGLDAWKKAVELVIQIHVAAILNPKCPLDRLLNRLIRSLNP